ncbi:MAG: UDP-N-acetylmuramate:L-alanyl-gamma-D-glutamyl-meso-diaminopimelate ligase [Pseudomonadota bacterium]
MHIHILGICGTFMAGIAALAREAGHRVTGSDAAAWPPMSTQLRELGIEVMPGYEPAHLKPAPDMIVVGNVVSRGNAAMEYALDAGLPYTSGPQWLSENILRDRHVLAVAGTHGKTTTSSLLAWLLHDAGLEPGFLIGGVPLNFGVSARLGGGKCFVVEADEYDTAFFDKRSKFVHYRPRTCVLNNLEYDHADIFPDLASIERQFHHLVRTVPKAGRLIVNGADANLARVLAQGCWSEVTRFNTESDRQTKIIAPALPGEHNRANALAAMAAAAHVGVKPDVAARALASFQNVRRRLEKVGEVKGVTVYDDFAHHPTAIQVTIDALKGQGKGRILAVLEPRSNTMRLGSHAQELAHSLESADHCFVYARADLKWDANSALGSLGARLTVRAELPVLIADITAAAKKGDRVLVMSNGDFGGIHQKLLNALGA